MSLTVGRGPFGHDPSGHFDFTPPPAVTFVESHPRRVRALKDGEGIVDSERTFLVYRTGSLPRYAFPAGDVRIECAPEPAVDGYVTVPWSAADTWLEEEEEVIVHPRDPYHRIDILATPRTATVRVAGEIALASATPLILFETCLPPRYYFDRADIDLDLLAPMALTSGCAYKGFASYFGAAGVDSIAWTYVEPRHEAERISGRICFFQERPEVELELDGELVERPRTPWADPAWATRPAP